MKEKKKISFKKMLELGKRSEKKTGKFLKNKTDKAEAMNIKKEERQPTKPTVRKRYEKIEREQEKVEDTGLRLLGSNKKDKDKAMMLDEILVVKIKNEFYGLPVEYVSEISELKIVPTPDMPDFIAGIVEIREKVIPVIDLATRFGLGKIEGKVLPVVIINVEDELIGFQIEKIIEIEKMKDTVIMALPDNFKEKYLLGAIEYKGRVLAIIDPASLLRESEYKGLKEIRNG